MSRQDKATTEKFTKTLRELVKRQENKICADCKRNDPRWASWNIGVFLCIRCSGIHRGMGTHISKVKSVDLDVWTPEQMESIQKWGNRLANLYWEAHLKEGHVPPEHKLESFIRSKYESRRWALDGPPPTDPSILDNGSAAPSSGQQPLTQPAVPSPGASKTSHVSSSSVSSRASVTTRQPHAHQLLSANYTNDRRQTTTTQAIVPPSVAPALPHKPAEPENDIFSLDFHTPPITSSGTPVTGSTTEQIPKKDVKQNILSLYSSATTTPSTSGQFGDAQTSAWRSQAQSQPTSMLGNTGLGVWGASSVWTGAPNAAPAPGSLWSNSGAATQQQPNLFNTNDVWGSSVPVAAPNFFSAPGGSAIASQKKDDVFGDLWGGFK